MNLQNMYRSLETFPLEDTPVFVALVSLHLLPLLCLVYHHLYAWVFRVIHLRKHIMCSEVIHVPLVELQNISNTVQSSLWLEQECIL
jgi:hypothetical protein